MMRPKIFIDGKEGTTGLQIYERLGKREDIELLRIPENRRKDREARREYLNSADLVFLCLPDAAAREAVGLIENPDTKVIDASTAHRTAPGWVYGFPELSVKRRRDIIDAKRVTNPGCHATGFISIVAPLISGGFLPGDYPVTCYSVTGYSGGGKRLIAQYEEKYRPAGLDSPRIYALDLSHKHIPEMMSVCGLLTKPLLSPIVADYHCGMATAVPLHNHTLRGRPEAEDIRDFLGAYYKNERFVRVSPFGEAGSYLNSNEHIGTNLLELVVCGGREQTLITARFDNLGKGASGAAVQNMNLMLGFAESEGLTFF